MRMSCSMLLVVLGILLWARPAPVLAQACAAEREPNNQPAEAQPVGSGCLDAELAGDDQDIYRWTVSEADAYQSWRLGLQGVPSGLTGLQLLRVQFAADGTSVQTSTRLYGMSVLNGKVVTGEPLLLMPGDYYIGISASGAGGAYRLEITPDEPLPPQLDGGPSRDAATPLPGLGDQGIQVSGDLQGADDYFIWRLEEAEADRRWHVRVQLPVGEEGTLALADSRGNQIHYQQASSLGTLDLSGLGLAAGEYGLRLSRGRAVFTPYILQIAPDGLRRADQEEEPNNDYLTAWPFAAFDPGANRMEGSFPEGQYDIDFYKFVVDAAGATRLWEVSAFPSTDAFFELCLLDARVNRIQCREDRAPFLTDLTFDPGEYYLTLRSRDRTAARYTLQVDEVGVVAADREREPNDSLAYASSIGADQALRGRFVGRENDYFRFTVTCAPQLWRVHVTGTGLETLALVEVDGAEVVRLNLSGQTRGRLDDLYLLPGDHFIRVQGTDGDYAIRVIPLGPPAESVAMPAWQQGVVPDPEADRDPGITEREPNQPDARAERLPFDTPRSGRLTSLDDRDVYRFSLTGPERVRLVVVQPVDGLVQMDLLGVVNNARRPDGAPIIYETLLGAGDHYVALDAEQPSEEPYYLLLQRLNPLDVPTDQEPDNNDRQTAPLLPPTLVATGTVNQSEDYQDWYRLPLPDVTAAISVSLTPGFSLDVRSGDTYISPEQMDRAVGLYAYTVPANAPVSLGVSGVGAYTLAVLEGPGLAPRPLPAALPLSLDLTAAAPALAAFWDTGQRLDLTLLITNRGDDALDLELTATSSALGVALSPRQTTVRVDPGASLTVPLAATVLPNVDAALATRFSVRAEAADGASLTTWLDLPAYCAAPPVDEDPGWTTAGPLLGGLNVAWMGLGSRPRNDFGNDRIFNLFDEIITPSFGWRGPAEQPLTVELAGDEPVPVAGIILNPFGRVDRREQLRRFELLLSPDGDNFEVVLAGELAQNALDQPFVLPQPVLARVAQLRLLDNWRGQGEIGLGEFKVIATPDFRLPGPLNLLDPQVGGHVVSGSPLPSNLQHLVTPTDERPRVFSSQLPATAAWVVGFHHNRAAQITALHWRHAESDRPPEERFSRVTVEVSTESPVGPWQPLATWTLDPATTMTQSLALETPVWARFVRFVAPTPENVRQIEFPDQLAIDERAVDGEYRSALAEWGAMEPQAFWELNQRAQRSMRALNEVEPNDTPAQATPLATGEERLGLVSIGGTEQQDEDWYRIEVPADKNTIRLELRGEPVVSVDFALLDADGAPIQHRAEITGGMLHIEAQALPGVYYLRIFDPQRSIVFAWDTSGSVGPYLTPIYQSLAAFTRDIDPAFEVVNLLPFGDPGIFLLEDFSGEPLRVQQAFNNYPRTASSSSAELNLLEAARALAPRRGARAVVLMTDAESSSYGVTEELWQTLATVRPRVFSFEISSSGNAYSQDLMQDWATVNGGTYANLSTAGLFEQEFARATCLLRRPARYGVTLQLDYAEPEALPSPEPTPLPEPEPVATPVPAAEGSLRVTGSPTASGEPKAVLGGGAVELILDASGSMLQRLEGRTRIQIARETLLNLTTNVIPPGTPVALRVFGHREVDSCRTDLEIPLQPLDPAQVNPIIAGITAMNLARTPIAASLRLVAEDLADAQGQKLVILVTDGEETCDGDPAAEIAYLRGLGIDVRINIVGFALADPVLQAMFEEWAALGGGAYYPADSAAELNAAVQSALAAPYQVRDVTGAVVATGVVNGPAVPLPAGSYTVEVLTDPVQLLSVTIPEGTEVELVAGE